MIIQSIKRGTDILNLFSYSTPRLGITEIAGALGLAKGTVHNIVHTLEESGFLQQDNETRKYFLGNKLFTLGSIMVGTLEINQKASAPAYHLARKTDCICRLARWDNDAPMVILSAMPKSIEGPFQQLGPRVVAYASAIGRVFLAFLEPEKLDEYFDKTEIVPLTPKTTIDKQLLIRKLETIKSQGYALNNQELTMGQAGIAVPIFAKGGRISASISLAGPHERLLGINVESYTGSLMETAKEISRYMGHYPETPAVTVHS